LEKCRSFFDKIQIKAAVFDDGTNEGDAETAAPIKGYQAGEEDGVTEVNPIVRKRFEFG